LYPDLPSSRHFLDPLYLDLEAVADFDENGQVRALTNDPAFQVRLAGLRESDQVEYAEVAALKRMIGEALWQSFQHNHLNPETERGGQFRRFQQTGGPRLQAFALYEAWQDQGLASVVEGEGHIPPPQILYGPDSPEIAAFGREARERIEYHQYIQWQLELQLSEVGKRSMELGLKVGLSQSLAAGVAANGFDVWYTPSLFAKGIEVCDSGEQGDCYPFGPPVLPAALTAIGYEPFIAMLRFNMRHAGALCLRSIDMLERQLWLTGSENDPDPTIIVRRFADLLGIIALESWRNRCLVIGEHRGPLDDQIAKALGDKGIFISRPGFFQKNQDDVCLAPSCSPSRSVVIASRYDLSSLASFWQGQDLVLLSALCPRFTNERREKTVIARATDRAYLLIGKICCRPRPSWTRPGCRRSLRPWAARSLVFSLGVRPKYSWFPWSICRWRLTRRRFPMIRCRHRFGRGDYRLAWKAWFPTRHSTSFSENFAVSGASALFVPRHHLPTENGNSKPLFPNRSIDCSSAGILPSSRRQPSFPISKI
jgi:(1->4)-alpha-D-glucan 1-alpha-D-glucosylmutase